MPGGRGAIWTIEPSRRSIRKGAMSVMARCWRAAPAPRSCYGPMLTGRVNRRVGSAAWPRYLAELSGRGSPVSVGVGKIAGRGRMSDRAGQAETSCRSATSDSAGLPAAGGRTSTTLTSTDTT
ncbi:hypothetical protein GCM10012275_12100 [Longimycelium tulufanense]|uniref:Uncharacterized protein n=1 Tax=Longimycelium tulufanense TaxID=907463 RepID=A0A8J3CBD2_9PSEU|nr:hypothetical protein GCM10012275_12100 [Longimycelium tulufanense]